MFLDGGRPGQHKIQDRERSAVSESIRRYHESASSRAAAKTLHDEIMTVGRRIVGRLNPVEPGDSRFSKGVAQFRNDILSDAGAMIGYLGIREAIGDPYSNRVE